MFFSSLFAKSALGLGAAASLALGAGAVKHDNDKKTTPPTPTTSAIEVAIGQDGRTHVGGATVTSVSGNTVVATTHWGGTSISWTVTTNSDTKFMYKGGGSAETSSVVPGDVINFEGTLASSGQFGVVATAVRDTSREKPAEEKHTFEGKLVSLAANTAPTTAVLKVGDTSYTVNLAANTAILGKNWGGSTLGSFQTGDTVRVYGSLHATSTTVIDALVVRDATR